MGASEGFLDGDKEGQRAAFSSGRMEPGPYTGTESPKHRQLYVDGKRVNPDDAASIVDEKLASMEAPHSNEKQQGSNPHAEGI